MVQHIKVIKLTRLYIFFYYFSDFNVRFVVLNLLFSATVCKSLPSSLKWLFATTGKLCSLKEYVLDKGKTEQL